MSTIKQHVYTYMKNEIKKLMSYMKVLFFDWYTDLCLSRRRKCEVTKYRNSRRLDIAKQFPLTNEQKKQIDRLYIDNYGKQIDYVWHQNYAAHANHFDYRFFPELLYIPEFEAFQNQNKAAVRMIEDKNFLPLIAKSVGVKMPRTIVSCTNGILRDGDNNIIPETYAKELLDKEGVYFIKPSVDSDSGHGCVKVTTETKCVFEDGRLVVGESGGREYFCNYVVQELVTCHESIRCLYPNSVNSFRVISYIWHNKIELMPIIIRIGRGGKYVDNAHAGGIFCAVYDDGRMGDHAITEFNDQFKEHPDTHVIFAEHKIEHIDKIKSAAIKMHSAIPQLGVVNWDFTINAVGEAVLMEANVSGGSVWLPQMAHGTGAFGEQTSEVLRWLRLMKELKPNERCFFVHGKNKR